MKEDIIKIIKMGTMAPSGDNVQPWRFKVNENIIKLFNIPEKDNSLYNFKQNASMIAHGAVIENMIITAKEFGYKIDVSLFPDERNENHIADLCLSRESTEKDNLYQFIEKRATNRKPYKKILLNSEQKQAILNCKQELFYAGEIFLAEDKLEELGELLSINEQIVLENKELHDFLFNHIVWSEREEKKKKSGLYIKTLELKGFKKAMFKLVKNFYILKILNKLIKFSKKVAEENAQIYASSSAIVAIATIDSNHKDYINAGRLMQRVWLKATSLGLSAHPSTGIVFLAQRIQGGEADMLSSKHIQIIENAYNRIKNIFGIKEDAIKMIFRIGDGEKPSAYSSRQNPDIINI